MEEWRGLPFAPTEGTVLCTLSDLPDQGGKEVVLGEGDYCFRIVILRTAGAVRAFRNRCPPRSHSAQLRAGRVSYPR